MRALLLLGLLVSSAAQAARVVVCPITGMIDDGVAAVVDRAVREAAEADALVFEIDTPGGLVDAAVRVTQSIAKASCPTVAYIQGMGAISAGALISFACTTIVMAPGSNIGAATPVTVTPEGMTPLGEKEVSYMRAKMRALAESTRRNPALGEAMVDKDIELRMKAGEDGRKEITAVYTEEGGKAPDLEPGETILLPAGKLLTLTPNEALDNGLIPLVANSLDDVLRHIGKEEAEILRITPTWAERIFRWLTNPVVAGLLLMFGVGGLYVELKTPGLGWAGLIGLSCLALFFGAHVIIGIAEWLDVLLVAAGIALILAEVFLIPGTTVFGGVGIICVLAGIYMSLTGVTIPTYSWEYDRLRGAAISLTVAGTTFALLVYVMWKLFPHTPLYGRFVQQHVQEPAAGYVVQTADSQAAVGLRGIAVTMLRPSGRGRFGETSFQVVARGEYIPPGTPIVIVQVDGNRYVVEKSEEAA
ncbi:MAG TPA: NfeD family protein [Candidatus Hydrogenedentes bacterium]|nr:NfeD family protein [Candidatus Hydrogenedentota bacterium]HOV72871.1 NfeD family protein [Candidatus Hydrogenedentota bacterium]HPC16408.1 NfeD family protein [Candidatus Hydrogenedentota bacterium]HRT20341.1 NfeD family protein [Candidatus Hydrogenedentota bacterium]HRT65067.1 NfeD family protein [Candidatus Hydrogenedentota bacterium]